MVGEFLIAAVMANLPAQDAPPPEKASAPYAAAVRPAPAVKRNAIIRVRYESGSLSIASEGRALSSGNIGDRILVINSNSHKTFSAFVSGENEAEVK